MKVKDKSANQSENTLDVEGRVPKDRASDGLPAPAPGARERLPRSNHSRPDSVSDPLFQSADFFDRTDLIQVKYEMLRHVRVDGQTVAGAAAAAGMSRPAYYDAQALFEANGVAGLFPHKRGPRGAHKISSQIAEFIAKASGQQPARTVVELQSEIEERFGVSVHRRTIERARAGKKNTP